MEGRGALTIHDVTISPVPEPETPSNSTALKVLNARKDRTLKALQRCQKSIQSVEGYLATLNVQHIEMAKLSQVVADYDTTAEQLDERSLELEQKLRDIEEEISLEQAKTTVDKKLNLRATIGVFAESAGSVELVLLYGMARSILMITNLCFRQLCMGRRGTRCMIFASTCIRRKSRSN